jgi:hypothetical protein
MDQAVQFFSVLIVAFLFMVCASICYFCHFFFIWLFINNYEIFLFFYFETSDLVDTQLMNSSFVLL